MLLAMIYRVANHTVIYLGPDSEDAKTVKGTVPRHISTERYLHHGQALRQLDPGPHKLDAVIKAATRGLVSRLWFHRVWIFQELICSRNLWVQSGRRRVRWPDLCATLLGTGGMGDGLRVLHDMDRARDASLKMVDVLRARRGMGESDARDFDFALTGVATDRDGVSDVLPVDYRMTLRQVFTRMSKCILANEGLESF